MQRKNEFMLIFFVFSHAKNKLFSKSARQSNFFKKNDKNLFIDGLFQQVLWTWNENLCERSKKMEVENRIQKTDVKDEETVLEFLAQYEV